VDLFTGVFYNPRRIFKMSRLLFLPDDHTLLVFESALEPEKLTAAVNTGAWLPPAFVYEPVKRTPRQDQVMHLLAEGLSNKEIGAQLNLSPHTVAHHALVLKRKFIANSPHPVILSNLDPANKPALQAFHMGRLVVVIPSSQSEAT
jgi:DNA-binding CsgD family transcriptional regulator